MISPLKRVIFSKAQEHEIFSDLLIKGGALLCSTLAFFFSYAADGFPIYTLEQRILMSLLIFVGYFVIKDFLIIFKRGLEKE